MRKKIQSSQQCHLALLGPTSVKAACKMLVKLTPTLVKTAPKHVGEIDPCMTSVKLLPQRLFIER